MFFRYPVQKHWQKFIWHGAKFPTNLLFCKLQAHMQRLYSLLPHYVTQQLTVSDLRAYTMHAVKHGSLPSINTKHLPILAHPQDVQCWLGFGQFLSEEHPITYVLTEQGTSSNVVSVKIDYLIIEGPKMHYLFIGMFTIGKANQFTDPFIQEISYCTADLGLEDITKQSGRY